MSAKGDGPRQGQALWWLCRTFWPVLPISFSLASTSPAFVPFALQDRPAPGWVGPLSSPAFSRGSVPLGPLWVRPL
jgi:hypothetical protein